jgi:hypothetical protein
MSNSAGKTTAPSGDGAEPTSRSRGNDDCQEYRATVGDVKNTQGYGVESSAERLARGAGRLAVERDVRVD